MLREERQRDERQERQAPPREAGRPGHGDADDRQDRATDGAEGVARRELLPVEEDRVQQKAQAPQRQEPAQDGTPVGVGDHLPKEGDPVDDPAVEGQGHQVGHHVFQLLVHGLASFQPPLGKVRRRWFQRAMHPLPFLSKM